VRDPGGSVTSPPRTRGREVSFPPYRLDFETGFLHSGNQAISLRPKTWAVLCYLAERPGVLVTKEELLDAVWGGVAVTEATLTKSIGEIRDALNDEVRHPRFVETVHRRGFRFVPATVPEPPVLAALPSAPLVGREAERRQLDGLLDAAAEGRRQIGFVTGEAGIGKTALVDAFLASVAARGAEDICVATGQCVRRHSGDEPLMPVLEAIARLARGPHAARVVALLRERAPGWLIQLPWLVEPGHLRELQVSLSGTTPERMLRVFAQLVEELTSDMTLVLVLEDLHWADASTVDLVAILAERPERARLLLLGTYRPAEAIARGGPFDAMRRALNVKGRATEIALDLLPPKGVETYLAVRFGGHKPPPFLTRLLHAQTEGNPLFLVTAVNFLVARGWLEQSDGGVTVRTEPETLERHIPGSLRDLVEMQVVDLDGFETAVLEAASVAGFEFGAQAVAAALGVEVERVEDACEHLVRSQRFLRASDTEAWPDGAIATRYAFAHALYQRVLYARVPAARRRLLHQRMGERLELGFGDRAPEIATELAAHFEHGGDRTRAVRWLESAASSAARRFAPREAAGYMRRGLTILQHEPEGPERWACELRLTSSLGAAVIATSGFAADEAWANLRRARELAALGPVGSPVDLFGVTYMLLNAAISRADVVRVPRLAKEFARTADLVQTDEARLVAAMLSANAALWEGRYAEATYGSIAAADPAAFAGFVPGENPVVFCQGVEGWRLWLTGHPDRATAAVAAAVASARTSENPINLAMALFLAAQARLWRGDLADAVAAVEEGRRLAGEHGFGLWLAGLGGVAGGIALARGNAAAAVPELAQALDEFRRIGVLVHVPALLSGLAEASLRLGRTANGLAAVDEGLEMVGSTLSRWQAPELWRLRGELQAAHGEPPEAIESSFERALETARAQGALAFELRAATALARRLATQGRAAAARTTLAPRYQAFAEGLDTADLRAARSVLQELGA
jgi:DNA-binding winged helix-turn-helix (wHTH) protein/tetratricopeptide (TPR) repeat protein